MTTATPPQDLSPPSLQEVADFAALVHDLEVQFTALRPVSSAWDDDDFYATTERTLPIANAVVEVLLTVAAQGNADDADCRRLTDLLHELLPETEDYDLLADERKLLRGAFELTREAVLDGHGAVGVLAEDQAAEDDLVTALGQPHETVEQLLAIHKSIRHLLLNRRMLALIEAFVQATPLLHAPLDSDMRVDERIGVAKVQALFAWLVRRRREGLGVGSE